MSIQRATTLANNSSEEYVLLIEKYRRERNEKGLTPEVIAIREKAAALLRTGTVSPQAEEAARYI
ncbi:hypothetical protein SCBWM1_gp114 [Synechococcus phage S-CBWM1]|uniref:Uncharacterized protein n=1 Tax=Synechococcus phage S-CBWM1 TaxID=2053653 RepID=A0A3G1L3P3_9CAUD|nr:hypothetical protein HOU61_gp083 [Synechococcus phage S-CBWM1]ATW62798.1 hypothetical protein SCBWM1_gp114 [Synechococcus phage S-CBWM1]